MIKKENHTKTKSYVKELNQFTGLQIYTKFNKLKERSAISPEAFLFTF